MPNWAFLKMQARRGAFAATALLALGACSTAPSEPRGPVVARDDRPAGETQQIPYPDDEETDSYDPRGFIEPLHMRGEEPVRVGLLLPFSAPSDAAQRIASAMFDAAQLAAFEAGGESFLLIPKDTRGNAEGAASAARSALADGAEVLLGPLFSEEVEAVADVARPVGAPVIAFSSDLESGGDGVFLLSFPPELEIARVTDYAVMQGMSRFGLLAPATDYGERVSNAFAEEIYLRGGVLVHEERYEQNPDAMLAPARRLAEYAQDLVPEELRHGFTGDRDQPPLPEDPAADPGYTRGYQAVMMPEQGTLLRALAPLLPYFNVDVTEVKLLGVSGWNNPRLTREPALRGGWFAAPDPEVTAAFSERFEAAFGQAPPRLASLAYDATLLSARLAQTPRDRGGALDLEAITDPNGFYGADGLFRLTEEGEIERGLAILEIQPGGIKVIDPAPRSFAPSF